MADDADRAAPLIESVIAAGVEQARRAGSQRLPAIGVCYFCEETTPRGRLFCDTECQADYEIEQRQREITGR